MRKEKRRGEKTNAQEPQDLHLLRPKDKGVSPKTKRVRARLRPPQTGRCVARKHNSIIMNSVLGGLTI